jgi:hypothetical protein
VSMARRVGPLASLVRGRDWLATQAAWKSVEQSDVLLEASLFGWALVLPFLKYLIPLPRLVQMSWQSPRQMERRPERERRVVELAYRISRIVSLIEDGNCLVRSLMIYRLLSRENAEPRLVVGLRSNRSLLRGHVWVLVDRQPAGESFETLAEFQPVIAFGSGGAIVPIEAEA